ncbi:hypothetical protein ACFX14_002547 [Malus domestica]
MPSTLISRANKRKANGSIYAQPFQLHYKRLDLDAIDINMNHVGLDLDAIDINLKSDNLVNSWIEYDGLSQVINVSVSYSNLKHKDPGCRR